MGFIEAPAFTRVVREYFDDDGYACLQQALEQNPEAGDLVPNTGGFRKLRWQDVRRRKGTRGGLRVIYYHFISQNQIWLMTIYNKNEAVDLTAREKKLLKQAIQAELESRRKERAYPSAPDGKKQK